MDSFKLDASPIWDIIPNSLISWLKVNKFFEQPASVNHHGNKEGGLYEHSKAVMNYLVKLTNCKAITWGRYESPYIIGMFHDLCKIDRYITTEDSFGFKIYSYNKNPTMSGHGEKSIMLLAPFIQLTEEEVYCIRYHMGPYEGEKYWEEYAAAASKYPNVLLTHAADMYATNYLKK